MSKLQILRSLMESHADYSGSQKFDISLEALRELFALLDILKSNVQEKELVIKALGAEIAMYRELVMRRPA